MLIVNTQRLRLFKYIKLQYSLPIEPDERDCFSAFLREKEMYSLHKEPMA